MLHLIWSKSWNKITFFSNRTLLSNKPKVRPIPCPQIRVLTRCLKRCLKFLFSHRRGHSKWPSSISNSLYIKPAYCNLLKMPKDPNHEKKIDFSVLTVTPSLIFQFQQSFLPIFVLFTWHYNHWTWTILKGLGQKFMPVIQWGGAMWRT